MYDPATRAQWHAMLASIGIERGYKPGWAAYKYKEKFGAWPPYGATPTPIDPTPEVRSWVRSRLIAYAKNIQKRTTMPTHNSDFVGRAKGQAGGGGCPSFGR